MFNAYPQQSVRLSRWKLIIPLSVTCVVCMVLYSSLDLNGAGPGKATPLDGQANGVHFLQPFLKSSGVDVGLWTRKRLESRNDSAVPSAAGDIRGGAGELSGHPEIERLQKELEAERARSAAATSELTRLRGRSTGDNIASSLATPTPTVSSSPSEGLAASATILHDVPEVTSTTIVVSKQEPHIVSTDAAAAVDVPDSLWRNPPEEAELAAEEIVAVQEEKTTTSVGTSATTATTTILATTEVLMTTLSKSPSDGDHKITIKSGDNEFVVSIGRSSKADAPTTLAPPPTNPQSTTSSATLDEPPTTLAESGPGGKDTVSPPTTKSTTPTLAAVTTTSVPPTPAPSVPDQSNQIRISTGGSEIIIQTGGSETKPALSTTTERIEPPTSTTIAPVVAYTPQALVVGEGHQDSLPLAQHSIPNVVDEEIQVTSSTTALGTTTVASTSEPENKLQAPAPQESATKESQGTKITVISGGQSITIDVGGQSNKPVEATTTIAPTTTTPISTVTVVSTVSLPPTATSAALPTSAPQLSSTPNISIAHTSFQSSEQGLVALQTTLTPSITPDASPVVSSQTIDSPQILVASELAEATAPELSPPVSPSSLKEALVEGAHGATTQAPSSSRAISEYANLALRAR